MDCWGNLVFGQRASSESFRASRRGVSTLTNEPKSRQFPAPSTPPMFQSQRPQGLPPTPLGTEVTSKPQLQRQPNPQIPIASVQGKAIVSRTLVYRLYTDDQSNIALYEDAHGNLFSVPLQLYGYNPLEVTLNVYESQGGRAFEYIDDWGKVFLKLMREQVQSLTWQGVPISQQRSMAHLLWEALTLFSLHHHQLPQGMWIWKSHLSLITLWREGAQWKLYAAL